MAVSSCGSGASDELAPLQSSPRRPRASIAFGALHAALDPIDRLYARRRIDAFSGAVLDIDQIDPLEVRIILGAADRDRLARLMAVRQLPLKEPAGRVPFQPSHRR